MKLLTVAAACAALFTASASRAAVIVLDTTVDAAAGLQPGSDDYIFDGADFPPFSIQVAEGDTVEWTIRFLPGQTVTFSDVTRIFALVGPDPEGGFGNIKSGSDRTVQLLGAADVVLASYAPPADNVNSNYLAAIFENNANSDIFGGSYIASGIKVYLTAEDYTKTGTTTLGFDHAWLSVTSGSFNGEVPEPATWALMILGFGATGSVLRRRALAQV